MSNPKSKIQNPKFEATFEFVSGSVEETHAFGERLGRLLKPGDVVALSGELGSGKTTLVQGLARGLGRDPERIKSPTFVLMREYPGTTPLIHIDGYRLAGAPQAAWLDMDVLVSAGKVTVIEWAERFAGLLPEERVEVHLTHVSTNRRRLTLTANGERGREVLEALRPQAPRPPTGEPANRPTGEPDS